MTAIAGADESGLSAESRSELLGLARQVATAAGDLLRARLPEVAGGRLLAGGASAKSSPTDLVTDVDRSSEALIVGSLLRARPDDSILGEEGSSRSGSTGVTWVIDPLDGTINYLYGIPIFAVSIAASVAGRSVVGVVHNPVSGEMFTASEGAGAFLDGNVLQLERTGRPLGEALVGTGFSYRSQNRAAQARLLSVILPEVRDLRRGGSAALDLCWVACGRLDAYFESGLQPWDRAAGGLIAREAGATLSTIEDLIEGSPTIVAAAPGLEDPFLELLERAGSSSGPFAMGD
ncbi:MAG: inositol monophosphatase family protein [Acidimicrobiales bacterium]|jgi:fructose-1,6-bisphosphatase/inositol monophosphatase family enzyme